MVKKKLTEDLFDEDILSPEEKYTLTTNIVPKFPVLLKHNEYHEIYTAEGTRLTLKMSEKIVSLTIGHEDWTFKTNNGYEELIKRKVNNGRNLVTDFNEMFRVLNIASERLGAYIENIAVICQNNESKSNEQEDPF